MEVNNCISLQFIQFQIKYCSENVLTIKGGLPNKPTRKVMLQCFKPQHFSQDG